MDWGKGGLIILEENHYYPFGLKHEKYNSDKYEYVEISKEDGGYFIGIEPLGPQQRRSYQYKYQGQERQDELGLNWDSFKWRNYDYAIGRFMSIDPLAEKYSYQSPYNFSENRVIDGFELEGLEVVLINPTKSSSNEQQKAADQLIVNGSKNIPYSNSMVTVAAHGSTKSISNDVRGQKIKTGKELDAVLTRNSEAWKNRESNKGMTVVLYSCRTGANIKDKDGNPIGQGVAQKISASKEFQDVEIIAPDQRVYFSEDGPTGTYEAKYAGPNDEYKRDSDGNTKSKERSNTPGNWNVFKNGKLIRSYQGNWQPTNNPSWWDNLTKENKNEDK
jgi:RHS repeat-associated protein